MIDINAVPLELKEANAFVEKLHRHHKPVHRDKFRIGCELNGKLVGVVQCARPVARCIDSKDAIEVVRLCTDGTPNVCSFLYSKAARIAKEMGYKRIITYTLDTESGISLKACGWTMDKVTDGGSWDCPSRPRSTSSPICPKKRWSKSL